MPGNEIHEIVRLHVADNPYALTTLLACRRQQCLSSFHPHGGEGQLVPVPRADMLGSLNTESALQRLHLAVEAPNRLTKVGDEVCDAGRQRRTNLAIVRENERV